MEYCWPNLNSSHRLNGSLHSINKSLKPLTSAVCMITYRNVGPSLFRITSHVCIWRAPALCGWSQGPGTLLRIRWDYLSFGPPRCSRAFLGLIYTQPFPSWVFPWATPNHHTTSGNLTHSKASLTFIVPLTRCFHVDVPWTVLFICYLFICKFLSHLTALVPHVNFPLGAQGRPHGVDMNALNFHQARKPPSHPRAS